MSSPPSSAGRGPPSSPYAGTDPTLYSPETVRKVIKVGRVQPPVAESSVANGKKPVKVIDKVTIKGIDYKGLQPQPHALGTFINELSSSDQDFVSRFLFISQISDGTVAGTDHEMELYHTQHQMKLVCMILHIHDALLTSIQYQVFATCVPVYCRGVHLRFDSLRHACEAKQLLEARGFQMCFIDNYDFAIAKSQDTAAINEFEGQIKIVILVESATMTSCVFTQNDIEWLGDNVERAMSHFGTVRTHAHYKTEEDNTKLLFSFRVEFHSSEAATRAVASLQKDPMWDIDANVRRPDHLLLSHANNFSESLALVNLRSRRLGWTSCSQLPSPSQAQH